MKILFIRPKKKKKLVSGNAGDENNLHPGAHKFIFLIDFLEILLLLFLILLFCLFVCLLFFETINVYADIHSTMRSG